MFIFSKQSSHLSHHFSPHFSSTLCFAWKEPRTDSDSQGSETDSETRSEVSAKTTEMAAWRGRTSETERGVWKEINMGMW